MTFVVVALVLLALALALVPATAAALWWRAARRTRRELIDALAVVPEVAGAIPPGESERRGRTATAVARHLGLDPATARHVGDAARLTGLAELVRSDSGAGGGDVWATARAVALVTTDSEISWRTAAVLTETVTAERGRSARPAAAVRVAATYHAACASTGVAPSGALFATVTTHAGGHERRAAEALVRLVQGDASSV